MEGFGLPALEGRACGAPVITSRASAPPQVVGEAGALVDPRDVAAIRREIESLENPERQAALRVKGIERARQFTWDKVAAKVRAVLEETPRTVSAVARPSGLRKLHVAR